MTNSREDGLILLVWLALKTTHSRFFGKLEGYYLGQPFNNLAFLVYLDLYSYNIPKPMAQVLLSLVP